MVRLSERDAGFFSEDARTAPAMSALRFLEAETVRDLKGFLDDDSMDSEAGQLDEGEHEEEE